MTAYTCLEPYTVENGEYGSLYYPDTSRYQINGMCGIINLQTTKLLFAEITGRQDWNGDTGYSQRTDNVSFSILSLTPVSFCLM